MHTHTHTWAFVGVLYIRTYTSHHNVQLVTSVVSKLLLLQLSRRSTARSSEIQGTISGNPPPHMGWSGLWGPQDRFRLQLQLPGFMVDMESWIGVYKGIAGGAQL